MEGLSSSDRCTERCALATELAQVLDMARELEAHYMGVGGGGAASGAGGERCRALVSSMRSSVDRSIHIAMSSCCAEGRLLGAAPESPPSADRSPRSGGEDQAAESSRCRGGNAAAGHCKKRKMLPKWSMQVRVSSVQDVTPLDDGFSWRKYGQKDILGAKYPRAYFRCTHRHTQSCHASKQVQRADGDPLLFDVVYHGNHTCAQGTHSNRQRPPPPAASAQHSQEQSFVDVSVEYKDEGSAQGLELEPMLPPFSFPSRQQEAAAAGADTGVRAARISGFPSCTTVTASPLVSPATSECQASGSMGMAGVRSVPDVELASTMGDMDFMLKLDVDFFDNSGYF